MQEIKIKRFTDFHHVIENYDARTVIYRGMKSVDYPLIPKIGRVVPPDSVGSREKNELEILRLFKERHFNTWTLPLLRIGTGWQSDSNMACPRACSIGPTIRW